MSYKARFALTRCVIPRTKKKKTSKNKGQKKGQEKGKKEWLEGVKKHLILVDIPTGISSCILIVVFDLLQYSFSIIVY